MLRFRILVSALPLLVAGVFARGEFAAGTQPCIVIGDTAVEIASAPWQAQRRVSFTDNPASATVRVQIVDDPAAADFVVMDDIATAEASGCPLSPATRLIGIADTASEAEPVIFLSREGNPDYRVFVRSQAFTVRDAAALIVGAGGGHARMAAAAL